MFNQVSKKVFTLYFLIAFTISSLFPVTANANLLPAVVPEPLTVNSINEIQANDGSCTLREAILNANADNQSGSTDCLAGGGADTILFNLSYPNTIVLVSSLPNVTGNLTIQGPGANKLTVSGNNAVRILYASSGSTLTLSGLTLYQGKAGNGGAISNYGALNVDKIFFASNTSTASSGAIYNDGGALVVSNSTFHNNSATSAGGAIGNYGGNLSVINSTFSGNHADGPWGGGAIYTRAGILTSLAASNSGGDAPSGISPAGGGGPSATINFSTFSGNSAGGSGAGIGNGGAGETGAALTVQNSLLAGNMVSTTEVNCYTSGGTWTDGGYNLEKANTCGFSGTSLQSTDPLLLGLSFNGGPTKTFPIQRSSPAIDRIPTGTNGCGSGVNIDQRGLARPVDGNNDGTAACDVGAYESDQRLGPSFVVNQAADDDGVCGYAYCTLRQAIQSTKMAPGGAAQSITFNMAYPNTIVLGSSLPEVTGVLGIQGPGANKLTVSGNNAVRILSVPIGVTLTLSGLTLYQGKAGNGAAIYNNGGTLNVDKSFFASNTSTASSGAIYNYAGSLVVSKSTFLNNSSFSAGGAIGNYGGNLSVINSTFSQNSAGAYGGGAIYSRAGVLTSIAASDSGGDAPSGISPAGGGGPSVTINFSTFSGNSGTGSAANSGAAIGNGGIGEVGTALTVQNSLLARNMIGTTEVNCYTNGGTWNDGGYNLENANTCGFSGTSLKNTDPLLLGLGWNGGPTQTFPVQRFSPAIDRIPTGTSDCGNIVTVDQRGLARPVDGNSDGTAACDVGAYEFDQQPGPNFVVNMTTDEYGVCGIAFCTLREAITSVQMAPVGPAYTISFNLIYPNVITLKSSLPDVVSVFAVRGPVANSLIIDGKNAVRFLNVMASGALTISGLTFFRGNAANGGAITNAGTLNIDKCNFIDNNATASSGAIYNHGGYLAVTNSAFVDNSSFSAGGAIGNYGGIVSVTNSTFSGNHAAGAWGGGAIYMRAAALTTLGASNSGSDTLSEISPAGGGGPSVTINFSTFSGNSATGGGAAIGNGGNGEVGATLILKNSLLSGNLVGSTTVNCYTNGGVWTDGGYNLENGDTCSFTGTSLKNTNPQLLNLGYYGASTTPAFALKRGSPAIDRIPSGTNGCGSPVNVDQRGFTRPIDGDKNGVFACDVGAYEYNFWVYLPKLQK